MDGVGLPWLIQIFTVRCSRRRTLKDHHLFQRHLQVKMCLRCFKITSSHPRNFENLTQFHRKQKKTLNVGLPEP